VAKASKEGSRDRDAVWRAPSRPAGAGTSARGRGWDGPPEADPSKPRYSAASLRSSRGSGNTMSSITVETVSTITS
jgi:hypothetical protein